MDPRLRGDDCGGRIWFASIFAEVGIKAPKSQSNNPSLALPLENIRGGNNYVVALKDDLPFKEVIDERKANAKSEVKR
jgi:hypothetical protein